MVKVCVSERDLAWLQPQRFLRVPTHSVQVDEGGHDDDHVDGANRPKKEKPLTVFAF